MMPDFFYEQQYSGLVAGIDEAGRGPWAGPVVAAAVIFPRQSLNPMLLDELDDSKKLSAKKREQLFPEIMQWGKVGVGLASVEEIDQINILQATFLAMQRAIDDLPVSPQTLLIDGNQTKNFAIPTQLIIQGDSKSYSIAAASIIAKVTRDRIMQALSCHFPVYGWQKNAGYGTSHHHLAMQTHGITIHHRRTFRPVRQLLENHPSALGRLQHTN